MVALGFGELSPDMGEATYGSDCKLCVTLDEGAVGAQAVALEVALEGGFCFFSNEDVIEAGMERSDMDRSEATCPEGVRPAGSINWRGWCASRKGRRARGDDRPIGSPELLSRCRGQDSGWGFHRL